MTRRVQRTRHGSWSRPASRIDPENYASAVDFRSRRSEHVIPDACRNLTDDRRLLTSLPYVVQRRMRPVGYSVVTLGRLQCDPRHQSEMDPPRAVPLASAGSFTTDRPYRTNPEALSRQPVRRPGGGIGAGPKRLMGFASLAGELGFPVRLRNGLNYLINRHF